MPTLAVNGTTLNVTDISPRGRRRRARGSTPIVMIHGLAASQAFWYAAGAPLVSFLGPCVLYDLRGHGKSGVPDQGYSVGDMATDLEALMDAKGIARAHLVAHSFGGMIALKFAMRSPDRVASLVLADVRVRPVQPKVAIPYREMPPAVEERLREIGIDLNGICRADDGIDYLKTVAKIEVAGGDEANELLRQVYRHPRLFRSRRNANRWINLVEKASLVADLNGEEAFRADDLTKLYHPKLVMVGGRSTTLPSARAVARMSPNSTLREIPDAGHFFPMSQPKQFLRYALRFLHDVNNGEAALAAEETRSVA